MQIRKLDSPHPNNTCIEALTPSTGDPSSECSDNTDTVLFEVGGGMTMCFRHLFLLGRGIADMLAAERGITISRTPDTTLPPLVPDEPRRKMLIEIEVSANFEKRLDNQWEVEREIQADRWSWTWGLGDWRWPKDEHGHDRSHLADEKEPEPKPFVWG